MRLDVDRYRLASPKHERVQLMPRRKAADETPANVDENRARAKTSHMPLCHAFVKPRLIRVAHFDPLGDNLEADPRHRVILFKLSRKPARVFHHKLFAASVRPVVTDAP